MTASLIQALFSEIKAILKVDMNLASEHLNELGDKTNLLEELLLDLVEEHFTERIAMYIMLGCTLLVSIVSVWCMRRSLQEQDKMRRGILNRIDQVMNQGEMRVIDQGNARVSLRKERQSMYNSPTAFSRFSETGVAPPGQLRDLALTNQ